LQVHEHLVGQSEIIPLNHKMSTGRHLISPDARAEDLAGELGVNEVGANALTLVDRSMGVLHFDLKSQVVPYEG